MLINTGLRVSETTQESREVNMKKIQARQIRQFLSLAVAFILFFL